MGNNKQQIEDALISYLIWDTIQFQIKLRPSLRAKHGFYLAQLGLELRKYLKVPAIKTALKLAAKPVMAFFNQRQWSPRKRYMLLSSLTDAVYMAGADIGTRNQLVVRDMTQIIANAYNSEEYQGIEEEDAMVIQHVPEVLDILKKQGYF